MSESASIGRPAKEHSGLYYYEKREPASTPLAHPYYTTTEAFIILFLL